MDYKFPRQLFPSFFNSGPPAAVHAHCVGGWGTYGRVAPAGAVHGDGGRLSGLSFTSRHQIRAETWLPVEPVPLPLLSPKHGFPWSATPPNPQDFSQQMENFFMDHQLDAFGCMSDVLKEELRPSPRLRSRAGGLPASKVKRCIEAVRFKKCELAHVSTVMNSYSDLLLDVVHDVPPALLGGLLHEELSEQRDRALFSEAATGGALAFVPFTRDGGGASRHGCLLYPTGPASDRLNFHKVALRRRRGGPSFLDADGSKPFGFKISGPVVQISSAAPISRCCVAVRSAHMCGFWTFSETDEPRLHQAVQSQQRVTCVCVSPHVPGEVLLSSESGAASLWTVGKGTQVFREEQANLYFNAQSRWRWVQFSAHPRVMVYADRTGVELTDMRARGSSHTLFRISSTSECKRGERVVLSRYLADAHAFHHLVTTQHSAYVLDERFPCVPVLKWDHMMESPPMFCHVLPGSAPSRGVVGGANSTKLLLGSQRAQEITLLQYTGGRSEACVSRGPPQALLRPRDSLEQLPVQIPHRLATARSRLSTPAAGLTGFQTVEEESGEVCLCVLQLTEAGDVFYQILQPRAPESGRAAAEREQSEGAGLSGSRWNVPMSETSGDEDVIGPTQAAATQPSVPETPEPTSESSSDESEAKGRRRSLRRFGLDVVVNDEPELEPTGSEADEAEAGKKNKSRDVEEAGVNQRPESDTADADGSGGVGAPDGRRPVKLSLDAQLRWKRWLQKLMQRSRGDKPHLQHATVRIECPSSDNAPSCPMDEERLQDLRRDLRRCMTRGSVLVHAATGLPPLQTVPVPDAVDTAAWPDVLSQRLTVSWRGDERWKAWWEDNLGLNRETKEAALRSKRRRQKERRSQRLELSGSFTSSVSYQDLDDFSDSTGWSSATSQGAWSDSEGGFSQTDVLSEPGTPRAATSTDAAPEEATPSSLPPSAPTATPQPVAPTAAPQTAAPTATPHKQQTAAPPAAPQTASPPAAPPATPHKQQHQQGAAASGSAVPDAGPATRKAKPEYLSSVLASRGGGACPAAGVVVALRRINLESLSSQSQSFHLEEGSSVDLGPLSFVSAPWRSSSQRSLRPDLSQDGSPRASPPRTRSASRSVSQSLSQSLSQGSVGRAGLSQSSQPKKKKSRMGF